MGMLYYLLFLLPCFLFADEAPSAPSPPRAIEMELPKPEGSPPPFMEVTYQKQFYKMFVILILILVGSLVLIWFFRRYSPKGALYANTQKNIKILERRHLSPNTYLYHVQVGDKQFIIAESKFHVSTVANLDWSE